MAVVFVKVILEVITGGGGRWVMKVMLVGGDTLQVLW